jgi:transposase
MTRGDLTDAQWAVLEPLMPWGIKSGRPPVHTKRQLINGIRFRTRTGIPWRDLPERHGPWETVCGLFRRWQRNGSWHRLFEQLQARADAKGLITWDVSVDSTIARAHQHAAGARKRGIYRSNRPAVSSPSPPIMGSPDPRLDWPSGQPTRLLGVRIPEEPLLPAPTRDPLHDPGEEGPDPQPQEARLPRRSATEVRQD